MNLRETKIIEFAQLLLIAALISLMTSPPLANFFEILVFFLFFTSPLLRQRLWEFFTKPVGWWLLAFIAMLSGALFYGIAPKNIILQNLFSWRRLLLLPIAASLFMGNPLAKRRASISYLYACAVFSLYSYVSYAFPLYLHWVAEPGVVVRNHATQGMFFSVSILIGITALHHNWFENKWQKFLCIGILVLLFLNISLLMTGRSGYVALLVMLGSYFAINKLRNLSIHNLAVTACAIALIAGAFVLSPVASKKIAQAYNETVLADENIRNNVYTSVGVRVMFWRTTLQIIPHHPVFGVGTAGFDQAYANEIIGKSGLAGLLTGDPHNQYLKIAVEQGLLGLIIFLGLLFMVARQPVNQPFKNMGICVLLAWCGTSLANAHFSTFSEGHFIWIWLGIMLSTESQAPSPSEPVKDKTIKLRTVPTTSHFAEKSAC